MNNTNTYEMAFLALAHLSDKEVGQIQSTLSERVSELGGQVVSLGDVHYIRLAYEMTKKVGSKNVHHNEAYFSWVKLSLNTDQVKELDATMRANNDILRYMIITTESDDSVTNIFTLEQEDSLEETTEEVTETLQPTETEQETESEEVVADDLARIEGIGPVIATTLINGGLATFSAVADADADSIKAMLEGVKGNHDPSTWAQQAALARDEKWDELASLQDELQGGKEVA